MGIARSAITIAIVDAGVNASALASTDYIAGEITNYSQGGGGKELDSTAAFGGFIDVEKPRDQVELSFDITPKLGTFADRWESIAYSEDSANSGVYTMAGDPTEKAVYIQANKDSNYESFGFNNASVTMYEKDHAADSNQTATLTLKFSPTTDSGVSNYMSKATSVGALPAWTALDNN